MRLSAATTPGVPKGHNSILDAIIRLRSDSPLMTNPVCGSCGQSLVSGSRFCSRCGAPISFQAATQPAMGQPVVWNTTFRETDDIVDQKILAMRATSAIKNTTGNALACVQQIMYSFGHKIWFE